MANKTDSRIGAELYFRFRFSCKEHWEAGFSLSQLELDGDENIHGYDNGAVGMVSFMADGSDYDFRSGAMWGRDEMQRRFWRWDCGMDNSPAWLLGSEFKSRLRPDYAMEACRLIRGFERKMEAFARRFGPPKDCFAALQRGLEAVRPYAVKHSWQGNPDRCEPAKWRRIDKGDVFDWHVAELRRACAKWLQSNRPDLWDESNATGKAVAS